MSLIMDALRRAEQLRLKESRGPAPLTYPHPDRKKGRGSKSQWMLVSVSFVSACIISLILLKPASPPSATQANRAMVLIERKSSEPTVERMSQETLKKNEEPLPTVSHASSGQTLNCDGTVQAKLEEPSRTGVAFSGRTLQPEGEKKSPEIKPAVKEKKMGSLAKQGALPLPRPTEKEESPSKSIGVGQEGGNDSTLTSDVLTYFNSGVHFYNQKEFSKAIQAYKKVIELDRTYVEAYNNLGIVYQMIGDVERACEAYRKSTEINPRYVKGYNNLGILFLFAGRDEEALPAFEKALALNANNIESHINLGILFKKKGEREKAIESYQKALTIDPLHGETHYNIALLYEQLEEKELAISHYQQFVQLSSKSHPELVSRVRRHLNTLLNTLVETRGSKK